MGYQFDTHSILDYDEAEKTGHILVVKKQKFRLITIDPKDGYGACKSCKCTGWMPNNPKNDYCKSCGHHWEQHR